MRLADELEELVEREPYDLDCETQEMTATEMELLSFLLTNKDAILTALRGRNAVLEEAAKVAEGTVPECCGTPDHNPETGETYCCGSPSLRWLTSDETAAAIRAMKEDKQ